ncbi:MAG: hypothetical protein IPJ06_02955 [Saprospiraceae bacterium]|nr:hypothetical protein [Saprospiraceae bacterium]
MVDSRGVMLIIDTLQSLDQVITLPDMSYQIVIVNVGNVMKKVVIGNR